MKIVSPFEMTDAVLVSSTVPEDDAATWAVGSTYATGAQVLRLHHIYESLADGNIGNAPESSPTLWLDTGASNRWAAFDNKVGTATIGTASISWTFEPGRIVGAIALLELVGRTVQVTMTDATEGVVYDQTVTLVAPISEPSVYAYCFEPIKQQAVAVFTGFPLFGSASVTVTITATEGGAVECGVLSIGDWYDFADAPAYGASLGIDDYSRKDTDDWGNTVLTERAYAKRANWNVLVERNRLDKLTFLLASLRAKPCVYIGSVQHASTVLYGYPQTWETVISYPQYIDLSIELQGLI